MLVGKIYQGAFPRTRPAGDDLRSGAKTARSARQKRGRLRRQDQARQRHQAHAPGRRQRTAARRRDPLLARRVLRRLPKRLIYDKAADCDALRLRLRKRGIDLISPHRRGRVRPRLQDGRKLRRYKRRWKIERSISWLQNFRRLVTRYEHHAHLFLGFLQLACLYTTLRRF